MSPAPAPVDEHIALADLARDPYPLYRRLRAEAPVLTVKSVGRTFLTKAADTKYVKENPGLFSSDDPRTPMKRAFLAHTLMRKDHDEHRAERMAMLPALMPRTIAEVWEPLYQRLAEDYVGRLPRGGTLDLFSALAGPLAARILAHTMGLPDASDVDMQRWSQSLIDGAGNFAGAPEFFAATDRANAEMDACIAGNAVRVKAAHDSSALAFMIHAREPIAWSQMLANVKIAIGGGINEPRDSVLTVLFGLLTHPAQLEVVKAENRWSDAFEEAVRWVAPIQVSARRATEDTVIRDTLIAKDEVVMTIQASANRDEELVENGEEFDALRPKVHHQAFGVGPHHCAGAHLSRRTIGMHLLPILFDRFPKMKIETPSEVRWHGFAFRGPLNLPVTLN